MNSNDHDEISILLVEDDANLQMVLQDFLELMHYRVTVASDGEEGLELALANNYHLILLDIMLPKMDGFSVAASLRDIKKTVPIIFLTAKSLKEDRLKGFMFGCDDYITKPFSTEELNVRIKAILRRCLRSFAQGDTKEQWVCTFGTLTLDAHNLTLTSPVATRSLTKKEALLLRLLSQNKNTLVSRDELQNSIWGESGYFVSRSMDVFITRVRKYLKDDPRVKIVNEHGVGFKLEVAD
ncbi:response regulator transcription factor [Bacteroidales bacterium]